MNKANEGLLIASLARRMSDRSKGKAQAVMTYLVFTESGRVPTVTGQRTLVTLWHVFVGAIAYAHFMKLPKGGA